MEVLKQCGVLTHFDFTLPVGLRRHEYIRMLHEDGVDGFSVTHKVDGVRKLLCLLPNGTLCFLDRVLTVEHINGTHGVEKPILLDGEHCESSVFFVFDVHVWNGTDVRDETFATRYKRLKTSLSSIITVTNTKFQINSQLQFSDKPEDR